MSNLFWGNLNSSLGAPFALGENFGEQQTPSLVLSPKFSPNTKLPPQILEFDSNKSADSSLRWRIVDSHEAIQNNEVDCHESPRDSRNDKLFTFMPGSRLSEINRIFPIFLQVKNELKKRD